MILTRRTLLQDAEKSIEDIMSSVRDIVDEIGVQASRSRLFHIF